MLARHHFNLWAFLLSLVFVGVTLSPNRSEAQETYTPTRAQIALIEQGAKATRAGQYNAALRHYRAAVEQGPFNLARLGLGRALQKSGDCQGAFAEFKKVREDPPVEAPTRSQIEARLDTFIGELRSSCPGFLVVTCSPPELEATLDGQPIVCGEPNELPAGTYTLRGVLGEQEASREATVVALERTEVALRVETSALPVARVEGMGREAALRLLNSAQATAGRARVEFDSSEGGLNRRLIGWGVVGLGGAALVTGAVFTGLVLDNNNEGAELAEQESIDGDRGRDVIDRGERFTTLQYVSYGVGAALVVSGAILLVLDDPQEAEERDAWIGPVQTPDGFGAAVMGRF